MAEYTYYKGYYIGHGPNDFHSRREIDEHLKKLAIQLYKRYIRSMYHDSTIPATPQCVIDQADQLHKVYGLTGEEIEAIEIEAIEEI